MMGLVDTDVVFKSAIYGLLTSFNDRPPAPAVSLGMLAATKFVVARKLKRKLGEENCSEALAQLESLLDNTALLEPTEEETAIAESLELFAAKVNLSLDTGESQLCALLIARGISLIFTGDKRAISAMEEINSNGDYLGVLSGKVACFEQIILWMLDQVGAEETRVAICGNCGTDKALEVCFSCSSAMASAESIREGLRSYIEHLQKSAPSVIAQTAGATKARAER